MTPRERILRVMQYILAHPYQFSRKEIAKNLDITVDKLKADIKIFKLANINFVQEEKGKRLCAILPDSQFDELRYLQPLSDADRYTISRALDYLNNKEAIYIKKKLDSLYDFQKLGLNALRRPALERLNQLEAAKTNQKQVTLKGYRSNSNKIQDRYVEVFAISAEHDTIQAFDLVEKKNKHYKISRIVRVEINDIDWKYQEQHDEKPTDVFRIAEKNQKLVQLQIDVYAYNSLIDNYPQAKGVCEPGSIPNTFEFQAKVNPKFLGITNFIMNNAGHVKIIFPPELKEKVRERVNILLRDLEESV